MAMLLAKPGSCRGSRVFAKLILIGLPLLALATGAAAQAVLATPNIVLTRNGIVNVAVRQPDGKLIVQGFIHQVDGVSKSGFVRLNSDGSLDSSLAIPAPGNPIKMLLSGNFVYVLGQTLSDNSPNGVYSSKLSRFNWVTGTLDTAWNPNPQPVDPSQPVVTDIAVDPAGNLYTYGAAQNIGGKTNVRLAKFPAASTTGQADPNFNGSVVSPPTQAADLDTSSFGRIAWGPALGGSLYVVGLLTNGVPSQNVRMYRIDTNTGVADPSWSANAAAIDMFVTDIVTDAGGNIYVSGQTQGTALIGLTPGGFTAPAIIAKLDGTTGRSVAGFSGPSPGPTQAVPGPRQYGPLALDGAGAIYTQRFNYYGDGAVAYPAKFDANTGSPIASFAGLELGQGNYQGANAVIAAPEGIYYLGDSNYYGPSPAPSILLVDAATANRVASYSPNVKTLPLVNTSVLYPDGRIVMGGTFTQANGIAVNNLIRINTDGSLDTTFVQGVTGNVMSLAFINGNLYVGGYFGFAGATPRRNLARMNANSGSFDSGWTPIIDGSVRAIVGNSTSIYIQGGVSNVNGTNVRCVAKLSATDGSVDAAFQPAMVGSAFGQFCRAGLVLNGNSIYSALPNSTAIPGISLRYLVNGSPRTLVKLDAVTGNIDPTFDPNPRGTGGNPAPVRVLAFDGTSLFASGGNASTSNVLFGSTVTRVAKINPATGAVDPTFVNNLTAGSTPYQALNMRAVAGNVYLAGTDTYSDANTSVTWVRKLRADGTTDANFNIQFDRVGSGFLSTVEPVGSTVYVGGAFNQVNGARRIGIAAVSNNVAANVTVNVVGRSDLYLSGTAPGQQAYCGDCVTGTYTYSFDVGSSVTITARPKPGWTFSGWSAGSGSANCTGTGTSASSNNRNSGTYLCTISPLTANSAITLTTQKVADAFEE